LTALGLRLKLQYGESLSKIGFNFNFLRRYSTEQIVLPCGTLAVRGSLHAGAAANSSATEAKPLFALREVFNLLSDGSNESASQKKGRLNRLVRQAMAGAPGVFGGGFGILRVWPVGLPVPNAPKDAQMRRVFVDAALVVKLAFAPGLASAEMQTRFSQAALGSP
jgi:hypothetical protein